MQESLSHVKTKKFKQSAARMNKGIFIRKEFWNMNESLPHLEIILHLIKDPCGTRKFPKQAPTSL